LIGCTNIGVTQYFEWIGGTVSHQMAEVILPADSLVVSSNVELCCSLITPILEVLQRRMTHAIQKMADIVKSHFSNVEAVEEVKGAIKLAIAKGLLTKTELAIYIASCKGLGPVDRRILQAQQNRVNHLYRKILKKAFVVVSIVYHIWSVKPLIFFSFCFSRQKMN
jgi:hypothetical protein